MRACWRTSSCSKCRKGPHSAIYNHTVRAETGTATVAASPMLKVADEAPLSIEARLFGGMYVQTGVGNLHTEKVRSVRKLRLCGMIPNAESIDLEAIEQPEIGKVAGSTKTEFVSELWSQGYKLADDRIFSGTAAPCQIDILIGAN
ncbi:hypothetical protein OUZ56_029714 [Daphnia magna]|uniref:Uncharacterized protein n=1 Tax=Daphnia magna TaxID=35525 RepID=A0ABR0B7M1_9CRUS|nr:hypothetical protein OUZ56_029714 [Daphnia magna]